MFPYPNWLQKHHFWEGLSALCRAKNNIFCRLSGKSPAWEALFIITSALASILKQIFIFSVLILPLFFGSFVDRHFYPSLHFGSNFHRMQMYRHVQLVPQSRHSYANASACACIKWRNRHHGRSKIEGRRCALPRGPSIKHKQNISKREFHGSSFLLFCSFSVSFTYSFTEEGEEGKR